MLPAAITASETITSTGYALITSSINKDIFRTRAIENALQKIVSVSYTHLTLPTNREV